MKGEIIKIQPEKYLAYTTIDPNSNVPDNPDNYLIVTYNLSELNGITNLEITQGDYSKVADGKRYEETIEAGGWNSILIQIKNLAESLYRY